MTTLRIEKCAFRHTLGVRTLYISPLRNVRKHKGRHFGY